MRIFLLSGMLICLISSFSLGENYFYLDGECSLRGDGQYYDQREGTSEDLDNLWVECVLVWMVVDQKNKSYNKLKLFLSLNI